MTVKEFERLLDKLLDENSKEFERWYSQADDDDIKSYAEIGFSLSRHFLE